MPQQRKLTHDEVRDIRRSNLSQALAARKYGVDRKTIRNVRQGVTYQDVPDRAPIASGAHLRLEKKYLVGDALELLDQVPDGHAETVLTMAPPLTGPVGRGEHLDHVDRQRRIIQECLRAAGDFGVVMYVHRPRFGYGAGVDLGADIIGGLPLRQAIIWTWPVRYGRGIDAVGRGMPLPQNYASVFIFAGTHWEMSSAVATGFRRRGAVWTIPPPNPANAPPEFPLELARRCIALGWGRVLDPQAGTGTVALAAEEQGRSWTLFDGADTHRAAFERRLVGKGEPEPPSRFSASRTLMKRLTGA